MNEKQIKRYFANKKRFEKQGYCNEMDKDEIIGRALKNIDDKKAFENLSLNGRYKKENRTRFEKLSEKHSKEADNYMNLAYKWSDKN